MTTQTETPEERIKRLREKAGLAPREPTLAPVSAPSDPNLTLSGPFIDQNNIESLRRKAGLLPKIPTAQPQFDRPDFDPNIDTTQLPPLPRDAGIGGSIRPRTPQEQEGFNRGPLGTLGELSKLIEPIDELYARGIEQNARARQIESQSLAALVNPDLAPTKEDFDFIRRKTPLDLSAAFRKRAGLVGARSGLTRTPELGI